jgi:hypothetical protein
MIGNELINITESHLEGGIVKFRDIAVEKYSRNRRIVGEFAPVQRTNSPLRTITFLLDSSIISFFYL